MSLNQVLQSLQTAESQWQVTVGDDWLQGRTTFGGLLAAVGNEALRRAVGAERPLRSLQTTFIGPATPGTWNLDVQVLRVGKAVTVAQCQIQQTQQVVASVIGVYGSARDSAVALCSQPQPLPRTFAEMKEGRFTPGVSPNFMQYFAIRWADGARAFSGSNIPRSKALVRHRAEETVTENHVIALVDCIPTPALGMLTSPAPASSLVWTLEFLDHHFKFPTSEWWRLDTDLDAANSGYVNQSTLVINPTGRLTALSRQLFTVFG